MSQKPPPDREELATSPARALLPSGRQAQRVALVGHEAIFECSGSGEPPIGVQFLTCRHAWLVMLGEDLTDEFSSAAHADLIEYGLEVIAHGVWRDVQLTGDFGSGEPTQYELRYLALALG
jgi:hypothetical protein